MLSVTVWTIFVLCLANTHAQNNSVTVRPNVTVSPSVSPTTEMPTEATTTAAPIKKPDWIVKGPGSTGACLLFSGNISFHLNYNTNDGMSKTGEVKVPPTAKVSGSCEGFINSLVFTWPNTATGNNASTPKPAAGTSTVSNVTLMFIKKPVYNAGNDTGMGSYSLTTVFGTVNADFPDAAAGQTVYLSAKPENVLAGDLQTSLKCDSAQTFVADKTGTTQMTLSNVQLEAFSQSTNNTFKAETLCAQDTATSNWSIIAYTVAGVVLAAVLGTYAYMRWSRGGYSEV